MTNKLNDRGMIVKAVSVGEFEFKIVETVAGFTLVRSEGNVSKPLMTSLDLSWTLFMFDRAVFNTAIGDSFDSYYERR